MSRFLLVALVMLAGCQPTFNWRESRLGDTPLLAMMPCKPDAVTRSVPFVHGAVAAVTVASCETGGVTFALSSVDVGDSAGAGAALGLWREVVQKHWQFQPAVNEGSRAYVLPRSAALPQAVRIRGGVRKGSGEPLAAEAAFFAQGSRLFHVAVIGQSPKALSPEVVDTFFGGLRLQ